MSERTEQPPKTKSGVLKATGVIIVIAVISIISFLVVGQAKPVADETKMEYVSQNVYSILRNTYAFYMKVAEERAGKELTPLEVYYPNADGRTMENGSVELTIPTSKEEKQDQLQEEAEDPFYDSYYENREDYVYLGNGEYQYTFQNEIGDFLYDIYWQNKSGQTNGVDYVIKDDTNGNVFASDGDPQALKEAISSGKIGDTLKDKYEFCGLIRYYEDGTTEVLDAVGISEDHLANRLFNVSLSSEYGDYFVPDDIKGITIAMAVTKEAFLSEPYASSGVDYEYAMGSFLNAGFIFVILAGCTAVFVLAIVMMLIKPLGIGDGFASKIPLEFNALATFLLVLLTPAATVFSFMYAKGGIQQRLLQYGMGNYLANTVGKYAGIVEFLLWLFYFGVMFILLVAYFQVFRKGLHRYLRENTIFMRFFLWICRGIRNIVRKVMTFDLEDDANRVALRIVALNFVIIAGMCSIWFFGLGVLIIYSIVLFFILRRYYADTKQKYDKIVNAASKMENGDLNAEIQGELGMFSDLGKKLSNVQKGFKHAVEEEVKSQNMKTELITNVSHDLKTPLTAIITYINLLKDENLSEEDRKSYLDTLDRKSLRLKQLIEDLFEVSKLNSNNVELHMMKVDIISLIKQVEFEFSERFEEKKIEFRMTNSEEKIYVNLDGQKTFRIFENVFGNIIKYAMPSTRAYLDIKANESEVMIQVKNISENELNIDSEALLERFVRGDKSRNTEGSGLGLAIVNSLVEKQGGSVKLEVDGDLFKININFPRLPEEKKEAETGSYSGDKIVKNAE
ncbi:MAG: GHKL domain-containing protein [Lachnospiraceae bacterium]|nr:GHKL domain-containing protein [Lachnospiraceae bacterium]